MATIIVAQFAIMHGPVNFVFHGFDNDTMENTIVYWGVLDDFSWGCFYFLWGVLDVLGGVMDVSVGCSRIKIFPPISLPSSLVQPK